MRPPRQLLIGMTLGALLLVTACGSDDTSTSDTTVGLANPASEYCVSQGGEVLIVTAADGSQSGRCRLPDGTEVDEWEYYRASQGSTTATTATGGTSTASTVTTAPTVTAGTTATAGTGPVSTTGNPEQAVDFDIYLQAADIGNDCDRVVAVPRTATVEGAEADAMAQLLAGPTPAEEAQGLGSWFSAATAGMVRSVVIENRVARVDFDPALATTIPNASTSCGSSLLLAQLDATMAQFGTSDRVVYSLGGDIDAFYGWLQLTSPEI